MLANTGEAIGFQAGTHDTYQQLFLHQPPLASLSLLPPDRWPAGTKIKEICKTLSLYPEHAQQHMHSAIWGGSYYSDMCGWVFEVYSWRCRAAIRSQIPARFLLQTCLLHLKTTIWSCCMIWRCRCCNRIRILLQTTGRISISSHFLLDSRSIAGRTVNLDVGHTDTREVETRDLITKGLRSSREQNSKQQQQCHAVITNGVEKDKKSQAEGV